MKKRKKSGLTIGKTRSALYGLGKLLGDVQAVRKGQVGKRVARRLAGKGIGRLLGKFFK